MIEKSRWSPQLSKPRVFYRYCASVRGREVPGSARVESAKMSVLEFAPDEQVTPDADRHADVFEPNLSFTDAFAEAFQVLVCYGV